MPAGTQGSANTTILSAAYNAFLADLIADLNAARPVTAGGTGGTSAITGWDGLATNGTDIASAASINLSTATGPSLTITGTASISAVTLAEGKVRLVRAAGAFTLTASATLLVNGSASVSLTVTAEDLLLFRGGAGGVVSVARLGSAALGANLTSWAAVTRAAGFDTFVATPSSANLAALVTDETGTGALVLATSPTLVTPALGTPASGVMTNVTGTAAGLTSGITNALKSATTTVDVSAATAPTVGQVLTATSGTAATWQAAASGGMTLLGTLTTTSGTTQSLTGIAAGYRYFLCEVEAVSFTTAVALTVATSSTNGAAYGAAGSISAPLPAAANSFTGVIEIYNIGSTVAAAKTAWSSLFDVVGGTSRSVAAVNCPSNTAAVVDAIQFAGGTFDAGTIRIYGVK